MIVAPDAFPIIFRDAVTLHYGIAFRANGDARVLVIVDFVSLQSSLSPVVDVDAGFGVLVNRVEPNDRITLVLDDNAFALILEDVVLLYAAKGAMLRFDTALPVVVDLVSAHDRVAASTDDNPADSVVCDIVFLQSAAAIVKNDDSALPTAMNEVVTNDRIRAVAVDGDTGKTIALDPAIFECETSLTYIHSEIIPAAELTERKISHAAE